MSKHNATKKALMLSLLSMVLCISMLVGSTFAWFTDTATTGVNTIQAGTLDVALEMATEWDAQGVPTKWEDAEGKKLSFKKAANAPEGEAVLWEPGCTYTLPELRIVNKGNLALKYKVLITGIDSDAKLNEAIDWTITLGGVTYAADEEHTLLPQTGDTVSANVLTIKGHMQETAGNDYKGLSISGIGITVVATQFAYESDSKGNDYDDAAEYPVYAAVPVETDEDGLLVGDASLASSEKYGDTDKPAIAATVPAGAKLEEGATKLSLTIAETETPANFTVEITQNAPRTLEISMEGLASDNDKLVKVEFYIEKGLSLVEIDHNGRKMSRCSALKWVDADQEFYYDSTTGLVTMLTKSFSPFTYTSDKFQWDDNTAEAYATPVDTENKIITVASAEELALFKYEVTDQNVNYSGYTLNITADIDLGNGFWRPINTINNFTINGNGHTISNLLVRSGTNSRGYGFGFISDARGTTIIRDLTFDGADVAFMKGYNQYFGNVGGIVMAYAYGTTVFDNVHVINSTIEGYGKIGALLGMGADPGIKVTFIDCVSENNTIRAAYDIGGLAGNIQRGKGVDNATVENCTVKDIQVVYYEKEPYADLNGVTATFKSDDTPNGENVVKAITGRYLVNGGYYWCGYGEYYVSYGHFSYDAVIEGDTMAIANSEYPVNQQ